MKALDGLAEARVSRTRLEAPEVKTGAELARSRFSSLIEKPVGTWYATWDERPSRTRVETPLEKLGAES